MMDPHSGRIELIATEDDKRDAKKRRLVPVPDDQLDAVANMNRKQRRAWAAKQRKEST